MSLCRALATQVSWSSPTTIIFTIFIPSMEKTKLRYKRTSAVSKVSKHDGNNNAASGFRALDPQISFGILPIELTHSVIAHALGNYYTELIFYEGSDHKKNGEWDGMLVLLHVSRVFRMETIRLMGYLFGGSDTIVDVQKG